MKISIIGAGIAGLSAAIALRKYRPDIELELFEGSPELRAAGAGLALGANAILGFEQMGIKDQVLSVSNVLHRFKVFDRRAKVISQSDNLSINRKLNTVSNFAVHRADLQRVLLAELGEVPLQLNKRTWDFRQTNDQVEIRFADGSAVKTDYVIAADGIHSIFREMLTPNSKIRFAGYTCWRGVTPSLAGLDTKLDFHTASETWGLGKRFGIVPLTNGRFYWFACLNAPQARDEKMAKMDKAQLLEAFAEFHDPVARMIEHTDPSQLLWNDIIDFAPIKQFAFQRVLLLGDAAHATTPNMGQGACQAIEGAAILGKVMADATDPQKAFKLFEQRRVARTELIVNRSWQLGKIAQLSNPFLAGLRNFVFRMVPDSVNEKQVKDLLDVVY